MSALFELLERLDQASFSTAQADYSLPERDARLVEKAGNAKAGGAFGIFQAPGNTLSCRAAGCASV
jgi:hypothetical protein